MATPPATPIIQQPAAKKPAVPVPPSAAKTLAIMFATLAAPFVLAAVVIHHLRK